MLEKIAQKFDFRILSAQTSQKIIETFKISLHRNLATISLPNFDFDTQVISLGPDNISSMSTSPYFFNF